MDVREFMSVRRAVNKVCLEMSVKDRLIFQEVALLCHLKNSPAEVSPSELARYEQALHPTMTHRLKRLKAMNLVESVDNPYDKRSQLYTLSDEGKTYLKKLLVEIESRIPLGDPLHTSGPARLAVNIDAMGRIPFSAEEAVLLAIYVANSNALTIMDVVYACALLQPTVSMAIQKLLETGKIERELVQSDSVRGAHLHITELGVQSVKELEREIEAIVVRRRRKA